MHGRGQILIAAGCRWHQGLCLGLEGEMTQTEQQDIRLGNPLKCKVGGDFTDSRYQERGKGRQAGRADAVCTSGPYELTKLTPWSSFQFIPVRRETTGKRIQVECVSLIYSKITRRQFCELPFGLLPWALQMSGVGLILNISDAAAVQLQAAGAKAVASAHGRAAAPPAARVCGAHAVLESAFHSADPRLRTWTNTHFFTLWV